MADEWSQIYEFTEIYRQHRNRWDLELEAYNALDILRMAETYLVSLGFDKMAPSFWTRSTFYKTRHGQQGSWRAFVWDFFDQNEFSCALQGVSPPVHRFDDAFDAGAVYEIAASKPYIKYFLSTILQFQILKSLCRAAEDYGPLHKCNLQNSTAAGNKLRELMKLGSSVPWQTALNRLTGQSRIEADAMLEYFQPLLEALKCKNAKNVGWKAKCEMNIWVSG